MCLIAVKKIVFMEIWVVCLMFNFINKLEFCMSMYFKTVILLHSLIVKNIYVQLYLILLTTLCVVRTVFSTPYYLPVTF